MKFELGEVKTMSQYVGRDTLNDLIWNMEENSLQYQDVLEELTLDLKSYISECLRYAIRTGFDKDILSIDCGIPDEIIEALQKYENKEMEIELD